MFIWSNIIAHFIKEHVLRVKYIFRFTSFGLFNGTGTFYDNLTPGLVYFSKSKRVGECIFLQRKKNQTFHAFFEKKINNWIFDLCIIQFRIILTVKIIFSRGRSTFSWIGRRPFSLRRTASRSILNKALLQVSLMVLYNVLIPKRVDDCIRVLVHHEQAAQSTNVLDIDLGRKKVHRADSILPRDSVILNPNIYIYIYPSLK